MKLLHTLPVALLILTGTHTCFCQASQPSRLYEIYLQDKSKSLLPDFSFAGYHNGEEGIPESVNQKLFSVTDFGAKPDDSISDREAIEAAIQAADKNGGGIIFFPKGRFLVNEDGDRPVSIVSRASRIIFRGSGSGPGGTELYMKNPLPPKNPQQMWSAPPMFLFGAKGGDTRIGQPVKYAGKGERVIELNTVIGLKPGDWIMLKLLDPDKLLVQEELSPQKTDPAWKYLNEKGVDVCMYYQIESITGNNVRLHAPLAYPIDPQYLWEVDKFAHAQEIGIENIAFVGNWKEKFVHHRSWRDDSGFTLFNFMRCTDSWMVNCRFTDCNVGAIVGQCANISILRCRVTGNGGHEAITSNHSTNILLANLVDSASQWHSFGVSHGAVNSVLWHCTYPSTTCFESHASQPRNTLLDNVTGGLMQNRAGGAMENMPTHLKGLVLWNYRQTNEALRDFQFWATNNIWWKIPNPMVAGFVSKGTSFDEQQTGYAEGIGQRVTPLSLYEAQLQERLHYLPGWLKKEKELLNSQKK